jgi:hypothetical protein
MGSKLGVHINDWTPADAIIQFIERARPRVVKVLSFNHDLIERARAAIPNGIIIGRVYVSEQQQKFEKDPESRAQSFWSDKLKPLVEEFHGLIDAWEGYNETGAGGANSLAKYARFEAERTRILADHGAASVVGNFATGTPDVADWSAFFPALEAAKTHNGFLGLHEYSAPFMEWMYGPNQWNFQAHRPFNPGEPGLVDAGDTGWVTFRYRKVYREQFPPEYKDLPLIITEGGIDGGINPRPGPVGGGWKDFVQYWHDAGRNPDGPTEYLNQLQWYDQGLQQDPFVVGVTIFCFGVLNERWESFNAVGDMAARLEAYLLTHPASPWPETEVEDPVVAFMRAQFGDAFEDIRNVLPKVGDYPSRMADQIRLVAIHHTGSGTSFRTWSKTVAQSSIDLGLPAIPHHFLVYPSKVRYAGELLTARNDLPGHETEAINVALVGDFETEPPSQSTIDLAGRLCDALDAYLGRPLTRHGHRSLALPGDTTSCPGATAYGDGGWLEKLNALEPTQPPPEPSTEIEQLRAQVASLTSQVQTLNAQIADLKRGLDGRSAALQQIAQVVQETLG